MSLKNRILVIDDENSLKEIDSVLTSLQHKGLSYSVTHKSPETGKLKSHDYKVKGPVSVMASVTDMKSVKDITDCFLVLKLDESIVQTEKILSKQREVETLDGILKEKKSEFIKRKHRNAQKLLKNYAVVNPYAKEIDLKADMPDATSVQPKYLSLIQAVCLLRQYHKEVCRMEDSGDEYIEVDFFDIEIANRVMSAVVKAARPLSKDADQALKDTVELLSEKTGVVCGEKGALSFTVKELAAFSRLTDYKARTVIEELEKAGYLEHLAGSNGKTMQYCLSKKELGVDFELLKPFELKSKG